MAVTIKYTDYFDRVITNQEIKLLDKYHKIFKENDLTLKVEFYEKNILSTIRYYLQPKDLEHEVVTCLIPLANDSVEICSRESIRSYNLVRGRMYNKTGLIDKFNELHDKNGNSICYEFCDLKTGQPDSDTEKHLYNDNNDSIANFDYHEDGSLKSIWGELVDDMIYKDPGATWTEQSIYGLDSINKHFPNLLKNNPYYLNSNLLPILKNTL
jgi:hypothetical protein